MSIDPSSSLSDLFKSVVPNPPEPLINRITESHFANPVETTVARHHISRRVPVAAAAVTAIVVISATLVIHHGDGPASHAPAPVSSSFASYVPSPTAAATLSTVTTRSTVTKSASATPTGPAPSRDAAAYCQPKDITAKLAGMGEAMSSMYIKITLTNVSTKVCSLYGYPDVVAFGKSETSRSSSPAQLNIHLSPGGTYRSLDPGAKRFALRPRQSASSYLGSVLSYQGGKDLISITKIRVLLTHDGGSYDLTIAQPNGLLASAPRNAPIPLSITALSDVG